MKVLRTILIVGSILAAGLFGIYRIIFRLLEKGLLRTKPNGVETPAAAGLEYEEISIRSGDHLLQAWYVRAAAPKDAGSALLIYPGVDESISEWVPALHTLWEHGISAMVFDYSGFGNSEGRASLANLRQDAQAAYRVFQSKAAPNAQKYVLGLSLGSGVLLEAVPSFNPPPDGLILIGAFTSARAAAVRLGALPERLTVIIPDVFNNIRAVQRLRLPLLIVHSQDDELLPVSMATRILAAAPEPKRLVVVKGLKHNDMLEGKADQYLAPVVEFILA